MSRMQKSLPDIGYVRIDTVLSVIPVSKSTWWAWVASGKAPQPLKLSPGVTVWRAEDIRELINQCADPSGSRSTASSSVGAGD
jgi:prophage regulatory protein